MISLIIIFLILLILEQEQTDKAESHYREKEGE